MVNGFEPRVLVCTECGEEFETDEEAAAGPPIEEAEEEPMEEGVEEEAEGEEYECPSCGAVVGEDDSVCPNCGEEFE